MEIKMTKNDKSYPFYDGSNSSMISKSYPSIHFTIDPKVSMSGSAAKGLNALIYAMQRQARALSEDVNLYHDIMGNGNTVIKMPVTNFSKLIGVNSRNYLSLKKTIFEMGDMKVTWSDGATSSLGNFGFHNLFVRAEVRDTEIEFVIPPESRELFINDKSVAVIDFVKVAESLSSKYSIFLHDVIEEFMFGRSVETSITKLSFQNEFLRNALKVPYELKNGEKQYSYYHPSKFIIKVLNPAIREYNSASMKYRIDNFSHESGRVWHFEIAPVKLNHLRSLEMERPDDLHSLIMALKSFGLNELNRDEFLMSIQTQKDFEYLLYLVTLTEKSSRKAGGNKAGFFRTVFKNNRELFSKIWEVACREREIEQAAKRSREEANILEQKERFKNDYIKTRVDSFLRLGFKNEERREVLMEKLITYLQATKHPFARKYKTLIESGEFPESTDPMLRAMALNELVITKEEIEEYVRNQPLTINV